MKPSHILIMTATITPPNNVPFLARIDPQVRLKDYEKSLSYYLPHLRKGLSAIIFAENSNSDVSSLRALVDHSGLTSQVEFLVFDGLDYPSSYGRAYGEFKLVDYVMLHSQLIKAQNGKSIFWKITGRYIVKNIQEIFEKIPLTCDIYCNFRKIPKPWADMFLLAWTFNGYHSFLHNIYPKLKTSYEINEIHPEEMFIDLLENCPKNVNLVRRINPAPVIDGVKGADNRSYLKGKNLLKTWVRDIGHKLLPWLWI